MSGFNNACSDNSDSTFSLDDFFSREVRPDGIPVVNFNSREDVEKDIVDFIIYKINQRYGFSGTDDAFNKWAEYKELLDHVGQQDDL